MSNNKATASWMFNRDFAEIEFKFATANKRIDELETGLKRFACDEKNCQCYRLDMSNETKRDCSYRRAAELLKEGQLK